VRARPIAAAALAPLLPTRRRGGQSAERYLSAHIANFLTVKSTALSLVVDRQTGSVQRDRDGLRVYDSQEKTWRHLDFFQHQAFLTARVPRVQCPVDKIQQVVLPWAGSIPHQPQLHRDDLPHRRQTQRRTHHHITHPKRGRATFFRKRFASFRRPMTRSSLLPVNFARSS